MSVVVCGALPWHPARAIAPLLALVAHILQTDKAALPLGKATSTSQNELMIGVGNFIHNLDENLKSLNSGLELRKPDTYHESLGLSASSNPSAVQFYTELLEEWCTRIDKYLDDSDRSRWETTDSGPDSELEYWRRRTQRLTSITDEQGDKHVAYQSQYLPSV